MWAAGIRYRQDALRVSADLCSNDACRERNQTSQMNRPTIASRAVHRQGDVDVCPDALYLRLTGMSAQDYMPKVSAAG